MVAFYPHFVSCGEKATLKDVVGKHDDFNSIMSLELYRLTLLSSHGLAGDMERPDRATLEGMQYANVRALCKLHKVMRTNGGRDKTKAEMIDSLVHRFAGAGP